MTSPPQSPPPAPAAPSEPPGHLLAVGERVERRILDLLDHEVARWRSVDPDLETPLRVLRDLVAAGGKRLRPAFCHWAFVGSGGDPDDPRIVDAGAALELLHTFALVHDDVMDGSDQRRGRPTVHRAFVDDHQKHGGHSDPRRTGEGAAVLVGDFAFVYADQVLGTVIPAARAIYDELRLELCVGQYLDLVAAADGGRDAQRASRIERFKSGKYTVERPLHLGATLAHDDPARRDALSAIGLPLGEAFQMRDDLLGVYGDERVTGKPVGDDLREGKLTPLVAAAAARVRGADAALLDRLGAPDLTPDEIAALQDLLVTCGACDEVEQAIARRTENALDAIASAPLIPDARLALADLARFAAWRDR